MEFLFSVCFTLCYATSSRGAGEFFLFPLSFQEELYGYLYSTLTFPKFLSVSLNMASFKSYAARLRDTSVTRGWHLVFVLLFLVASICLCLRLFACFPTSSVLNFSSLLSTFLFLGVYIFLSSSFIHSFFLSILSFLLFSFDLSGCVFFFVFLSFLCFSVS